MKTAITSLLSLGSMFLFSNCTVVEHPEPTTRTTTTEETTISRPVSTTVETQTTRRF